MITLLSAHGQEVAPQLPRPAPQRPGSDLWRLLQSRQEEGGSPQSKASESSSSFSSSSSSSSSRPGSPATRQTPPSTAPGAGPSRRQGPSTLRPEPRSRGFRSPRGGGLARGAGCTGMTPTSAWRVEASGSFYSWKKAKGEQV
eukprot:XP_011513769.1 ras-related protein Ral-A isoform X2 [Homo sapiens]